MFKKINKTILIEIIILFIIFTLVFICIYLMNSKTGYISDDFRYKYVFQGFKLKEKPKEIENIKDMILSTKSQYNMWGGRVVAQVLHQISMNIDKSIFNIINTLSFILLGLLTYFNAFGFKKMKPSIIILIYMAIWFFAPVFGITMFWVAGAVNYMWTMNVMLLFILPYRIYLDKQKIKNNIFLILYMITFGFLAGMCNENTSAAIFILSLMYMYIYYKKKIKIQSWSVLGGISSLIGYITLVLAPGNYLRAGNVVFDFKTAINKALSIALDFSNTSGILLIIIAAIYIIKGKRKTEIANIYIVSAFVGMLVLIPIPITPNRTFFGPVILFIIASINLAANLDLQNKLIKVLYTFMVVTVLAIFSYQYKTAYESMITSHKEELIVVEKIHTEKNKGNLVVYINRLPSSYNKYNPYGIYFLAYQNSEAFVEDFMSYYYGVEKLKIKR